LILQFLFSLDTRESRHLGRDKNNPFNIF